MGLFGDKKKGFESLKTLSEKEIQSKLYGHLRTNDRVIQEDLPALSKPRQETPATFKSAESVKTLTPSVSSTVKTTAAPDLFKPQEFRPTEENSIKAPEAKPSVSAKIYRDKYAKPQETRKSSFSQVSQGAAGVLGQGLKQVGFKIVEIFGSAITGLFRLGSSVDFRKPSVRRFVYISAAVAALIFIFTGIHHLNKNREIAMKTPGKKIAQTKKAKVVNPSQPLQSALSTSAAEMVVPAIAQQAATSESGPVKTEKKEEAPAKSAAAPAVKAEVKKPAPAAVEGPGQVIQVATFATQEDASKLVQKFKAAGFSSFFKSVARTGGRVYYCVFIGKFATYQEAESKLAEFKKQEVAKPFQDAFIRSFN